MWLAFIPFSIEVPLLSYYKLESGNKASFDPFQYENAPSLIL